MATHSFTVSVGDQVFVGEALEEVGAVRQVAHDHLLVYIENSGDFRVDGPCVLSVHDGKVILDPNKLGPELRAAIAHAHEHEHEHEHESP
jgi:hypothetical protein